MISATIGYAKLAPYCGGTTWSWHLRWHVYRGATLPKVSGISPNLICAERLFCDHVDAPRVKEVADLFRNMTDLFLVISGTEQTAIDMDSLKNQFISELAEDKIMAWHKNHPNKVMGQLGMFLDLSDRPNPSHYDAKTSFFTWPEYITVMPHSLLAARTLCPFGRISDKRCDSWR